MKISKYCFIVNAYNVNILYNCKNESVVLLDDALVKLLGVEDVEDVKSKHPDFYDYLLKNKHIVSECEDESADVIESWKLIDNDRQNFEVTVNPTMDCNMKCWYCYEKHFDNSIMSEEVMDAIIKLIHGKSQDSILKNFHLGFFGGEPLLCMKEIVMPLLNRASLVCHENNKMFSASFVTNAYLLDKQCVDALKTIEVDLPYNFQITLDGGRDFHNKTRFLKSSKTGSYDIILKNLKYVVDNDMTVILRLNATSKNIDTFVDVLMDIENFSDNEKSYITIDIQHVWQDVKKSDIDFAEREERIRKLFISKKFRVNEAKHIDISRCYADRSNSLLINFNGDVFRCTGRNFTTSNREGVLNTDGSIQWNKKSELRDSLRYGNSTCRDCRIFPLCHGGCSQFKLDNIGFNDCIRGYDNAYKIKIIKDRIEFLLKRSGLLKI